MRAHKNSVSESISIEINQAGNKITGSVKTWETDLDLQCISLGQDLLASLDGEIALSRLWGADAEPDGSPNPPRGKSPQPLWFGEACLPYNSASSKAKHTIRISVKLHSILFLYKFTILLILLSIMLNKLAKVLNKFDATQCTSY